MSANWNTGIREIAHDAGSLAVMEFVELKHRRTAIYEVNRCLRGKCESFRIKHYYQGGELLGSRIIIKEEHWSIIRIKHYYQ